METFLRLGFPKKKVSSREANFRTNRDKMNFGDSRKLLQPASGPEIKPRMRSQERSSGEWQIRHL
jgi:hypothetical protein